MKAYVIQYYYDDPGLIQAIVLAESEEEALKLFFDQNDTAAKYPESYGAREEQLITGGK